MCSLDGKQAGQFRCSMQQQLTQGSIKPEPAYTTKASQVAMLLRCGRRCRQASTNNSSVSCFVCCAPLCTGQLHPTAEVLCPGLTCLPIMFQCMSQQGCLTAAHSYTHTMFLTPGTCSIQKQNALSCDLQPQTSADMLLTPSMLVIQSSVFSFSDV